MATVVIDPGHFDAYNPGVCPNYYEGNTMLRLAEFLGAALTQRGAKVLYTRTTNAENPSLADRGAMAAGTDLFISLHSDASDDPQVRGVTVFRSVQRPNSTAFGNDIGKAVANVMGNEFRGTLARPSETTPGVDYLGVLRAAAATNVPYAFLVEHGFHTNMQDCMFLSSDEGLRKIAEAEADVIAKYLGLTGTAKCRFVYTVQPGDSLFIIGQKFSIPWQSIASANGLTSPYTLKVGQRLTLPPMDCRFYYTTQPSDSLYSIGQRFGVRWQDIAAINGITAPYIIMPGRRLLIPLTLA